MLHSQHRDQIKCLIFKQNVVLDSVRSHLFLIGAQSTKRTELIKPAIVFVGFKCQWPKVKGHLVNRLKHNFFLSMALLWLLNK